MQSLDNPLVRLHGRQETSCATWLTCTGSKHEHQQPSNLPKTLANFIVMLSISFEYVRLIQRPASTNYVVVRATSQLLGVRAFCEFGLEKVKAAAVSSGWRSQSNATHFPFFMFTGPSRGTSLHNTTYSFGVNQGARFHRKPCLQNSQHHHGRLTKLMNISVHNAQCKRWNTVGIKFNWGKAGSGGFWKWNHAENGTSKPLWYYCEKTLKWNESVVKLKYFLAKCV